ncbi:MAG: DUF2203 domain-containing protein [Candidatus Kapabacteria bacterium]|nr:DUF2203 domain-containing protein [Candidatus Kapabacteria bacterium]MBX7155963.1 DUF2203 domain-containing protein [Bacteroidota bacterium]
MKVFTASEASTMLPLIKNIVQDILLSGKELRRLSFDYGEDVTVLPEYQKTSQQLRAYISELEELGCLYKDYNFTIGLVDFPAIINGQEVFLCWRSDEPRLMFYHGIDEGFNGRKLIPEEMFYSEVVEV